MAEITRYTFLGSYVLTWFTTEWSRISCSVFFSRPAVIITTAQHRAVCCDVYFSPTQTRRACATCDTGQVLTYCGRQQLLRWGYAFITLICNLNNLPLKPSFRERNAELLRRGTEVRYFRQTEEDSYVAVVCLFHLLRWQVLASSSFHLHQEQLQQLHT